MSRSVGSNPGSFPRERRHGAVARLRTVLVLIATVIAADTLGAQAAQPVSIQGSGLFTVQSFGEGNNVGGLGAEFQARYNTGRLSLGGGYQYTTHTSGGDDITLTGVFVEPRLLFAIGSGRVAPYLAGRGALLRLNNEFANYGKFSTSGKAFGAGAGFLTRLTYSTNLDVGAAVIRQTVDSKRTPSGLVAEFPTITGFVVKAGITIGFGR